MQGKTIIGLIRIYQKVSIFMGQRCRFYPTCSQYTIEAIAKYGGIKGLLLGMKRICRCNQYFPGGFDPIN